jgi:hypothetical protein
LTSFSVSRRRRRGQPQKEEKQNMNLNNIYNQEQFIARNIQERPRVREAQTQELRQHKPLLPTLKHLFGRRSPRKEETR